MLESFLFCFFVCFVLISSIAVVVATDVVFSVFALLCACVGIAVIFGLMGAYYIATAQLLLYATAVIVLFLFVLFFLKNKNEKYNPVTFIYYFLSLSAGSVLFALVTPQFLEMGFKKTDVAFVGTAEKIAQAIFPNVTSSNFFLLSFIASGVLLIVTVIATLFLAKDAEDKDLKQ